MPKDMCDCVDQSYRIQKKYEGKTDEVSIKKRDGEIKQISKHCRHLKWRGSSCTTDEIVVLMKKHYGPQGSFWDLGEPLIWVEMGHSASAVDQLDFIRSIKSYLDRFPEDGMDLKLFERKNFSDSTKTDE